MVDSIGRYHILEPIDRRAAGTVYKAEDPLLKRVVAIRIISDDLEATEGLRARFFQEVQASARLNHPNIVTLYDVGEERGRLYVVMQYLDGEHLRDVIAQRPPLALETKLSWMAQVCDGLAYAHDQGMIHRHLRPENIVIRTNGQAKILGFGVAQLAAEASHTAPSARTLQYVAPEQMLGPGDRRSDIFSLAVVCYELLTYHLPSPAEDATAPLETLAPGVSPSLFRADPAIPDDLGSVIERALRTHPDARFANVTELRSALSLIRTRVADIAEAAGNPRFAAEKSSNDVGQARPAARAPAPPAEPHRAAVAPPATWTTAESPVPPSARHAPEHPATDERLEARAPSRVADLGPGASESATSDMRVSEERAAMPAAAAIPIAPGPAAAARDRGGTDRSWRGRLPANAVRFAAGVSMSAVVVAAIGYAVVPSWLDARRVRTEVAAAQQVVDAARDRAVRAGAPQEAKELFDLAAAKEGEAKRDVAASRLAPALVTLQDAGSGYARAEQLAVLKRETQRQADEARLQKRAEQPAVAAQAPAPTESAPPVRDANAEIREVLRLYANVFAAKDLELLRRIRPRIRPEELARHQETFRLAKSYRVTLRIDAIQVTGEDAVARGRREDLVISPNGETFRTPGQFTFRLKRIDERWTIDAVK